MTDPAASSPVVLEPWPTDDPLLAAGAKGSSFTIDDDAGTVAVAQGRRRDGRPVDGVTLHLPGRGSPALATVVRARRPWSETLFQPGEVSQLWLVTDAGRVAGRTRVMRDARRRSLRAASPRVSCGRGPCRSSAPVVAVGSSSPAERCPR